MTVRHALLAILREGPCYGNQLRTEFDRRTGGAWPLNVGQVYTTLDRLERDGLVTKSAPNESGQVVYTVTDEGAAEAVRWLTSAVEPARDDLAVRLALAMTLPTADAASLIAAQKRAAADRIREPDPSSDLVERLVVERRALHAQAELAWLERCEQELAGDLSFPLLSQPPRRGRPSLAAG